MAAATEAELVAPYILPSPGDTWAAAQQNAAYLAQHTWVTTWETVIGFVIAAVVGVFFAVMMIYSSSFEKTVYPLILFAQVIPKIAIAPLFIVWLGFGPSPKILVAVLMAFFPIVISGLAGLRSVDPEILELTSTMGASKFRTFMKIRFPASLPQLMSGLKVAATLAVTGAVVGEFVGANEGLGYVILAGQRKPGHRNAFRRADHHVPARDRAVRDHRDRREAAHPVARLTPRPPTPPPPRQPDPSETRSGDTHVFIQPSRHHRHRRDHRHAHPGRLWRQAQPRTTPPPRAPKARHRSR